VVGDPDWDGVADALLAALETEVARMAAKDQELAGDIANERLAAFSARHGFVPGKVHHVLVLPAAGIEQLSPSAVPPVDVAWHQALVALHETAFPATYYSGRQLLDQAARGDAIVLGLVEGNELVGYAAGRIDEGGDGYVDFVAVRPERRRLGHGVVLVGAISRALAATAPIEAVRLTVSSENLVALALYDTLGFEQVSSAVGYRRRPEPEA
jgi:ribosomal protein S18 acetylase RimI-like enzyme